MWVCQKEKKSRKKRRPRGSGHWSVTDLLVADEVEAQHGRGKRRAAAALEPLLLGERTVLLLAPPRVRNHDTPRLDGYDYMTEMFVCWRVTFGRLPAPGGRDAAPPTTAEAGRGENQRPQLSSCWTWM